MTLLADLADVSARVGSSPSRLAKIAELAAFLRTLEPGEIRIGVQYLAGQAPQGRFGIGPSVLREDGFLLGRTGAFDNVIKIRPPLVFTPENARMLLDGLDRALGRV